jgi:adenylyltransferase/sulfurtransferase
VTGLSPDEIERYRRHLALPEVGMAGQQRLRSSSVLCVGAGGLGSPVLLYLAAAGIGRLGVVDFDAVERSNLQRQIVHRTADVGRAKTESARQALTSLNPEVEVVLHEVRLACDNALDLLRPYDVVVDGTDNFPTRYLTNDVCVLLRKPNIYGSVFRFEGQASVFAPHLGGPCYRCLYPEPPPPGAVPSCVEAGVLGVLPGMIGLIQATETLKLVLGIGQPLIGRLVLVNAWEMKFKELKLRRDPRCPVCGESPTITRLIDYEQCCGGDLRSVAETPADEEVSVQEMKQALADPRLGIRVLDVREPAEHAIASVAGVALLPLSQLPQRCQELDPRQSYYLCCKSGVRSLKAMRLLRERGFRQVKSVRGGITAWSETIDPTVPRY